jgi:hypothetical protein
MNTEITPADITAAIGTEVNLVRDVTTMLQLAGHPEPEAWTEHLDRNAFDCSDLKQQRFLINRCWRSLLGKVTTENTMDVRYCLIDDGTVLDWTRIFKESVIPCLVRLQLPLKK